MAWRVDIGSLPSLVLIYGWLIFVRMAVDNLYRVIFYLIKAVLNQCLTCWPDLCLPQCIQMYLDVLQRKNEEIKHMKIIKHVSLFLALTMAAVQANAALITFDIQWEGEVAGTTASGELVIEDTEFVSDGFNNFLFTPLAFVDFSMEFTGGANDGLSFGILDFTDILFLLGGPVDFSTDLVGQASFLDFNVFSTAGPNGFVPLVLDLNFELYEVTSVQQSTDVPAPTGVVFLLAGLVGALGVRGRMKK